MRTLNIVGCGRAGRTFARLFHQTHAFVVQDLFDVNQAAARACSQFAEAGAPVRRLAQMRPAQVWLFGTPLMIAAFVYNPSPALVLVAILAVPHLIRAWKMIRQTPKTPAIMTCRLV